MKEKKLYPDPDANALSHSLETNVHAQYIGELEIEQMHVFSPTRQKEAEKEVAHKKLMFFIYLFIY